MASQNDGCWNPFKAGGGHKKLATVKYDISFRTEGEMPPDVPMGEDEEWLEVMWEREDLLFDHNGSGGGQGHRPNAGVEDQGQRMEDDGYQSDVDPEIASYIKDFNRRKKRGGMVNGEYVYYDESMCCIRNIHNSSHSLTQYGSVNHDDFGKKKAMRPIMTAAEKIMLGLPQPTASVSMPVPISQSTHRKSPSFQLPPDVSAVQELVPALEKIFIGSPNAHRGH